jgi:hypothetical protein
MNEFSDWEEEKQLLLCDSKLFLKSYLYQSIACELMFAFHLMHQNLKNLCETLMPVLNTDRELSDLLT